MTRLGRLGAVVILATGTLLVASSSARADHCQPRDNPKPIPGQNTTYCHTPEPTPAPKTPAPTAPPTAAPTAAPTRAPSRPVAPVRTNSGGSSTPAPTVDIEIPDENPLATPQIIVEGPLEGGENFSVDDANTAASASSWIFGFIVGLIVGGLIGRASWGLRRRRGGSIFG